MRRSIAVWIAGVVSLCVSAGWAEPLLTVAEQRSQARTAEGQFIAWREHRIDDEAINGGVKIRGGDGLRIGDFDRDGFIDIVSVHEDSHHLRIAFGSASPDRWTHATVAVGRAVGAIEDVAVGDLNGDGWLDLVVACEEAHIGFFENPKESVRAGAWPHLIPPQTTGRGSWLRVAFADMDNDGQLEVLGANKGTADVVRPDGGVKDLATSLFWIDGPPLNPTSWREQVLMQDGVPNHVVPADVDNDGDLDVLAAARVSQRMMVIENKGMDTTGRLQVAVHPIGIAPGAFAAAPNWRAASNAFAASFAQIDEDQRPDLLVNVSEFWDVVPGWEATGLAWLCNPSDLTQPWQMQRIGHTLPDWIIGIGAADIDGDGDVDAMVGGYSGLNILKGGYSGASRDVDDPRVTPSSTVGRLAWFENPGNAHGEWQRHDISRRVRGMYDAFEFYDMDRDGDLDVIATRGNSGSFDGVFWLEQIRSDEARAAFTPARKADSRALPLPPSDWRSRYTDETQYVAPNKAAQQRALDES